MKFIEIDLDGTVVRATLNEEGAPKTSQAIWDALPFGGRAVHAQISGEMFRMLDETPVAALELEEQTTHQFPGQLVYYPPIREIAFCVGESRFSGGVIPSTLTNLGAIEGDFSAFAKKGDALDRTGTKPIRFRRAADQATPFRPQAYPPREGAKLTIDLDGVSVSATLLENVAPKTTAALKKLLPIDAEATNDTWGAQVTRVWGPGPDGSFPVAVSALESPKHLSWPGYVYFEPTKQTIRIAYGEGDIKDVSGILAVTPVAVIEPAELGAYAAKARAQLLEGAKRIRIAIKR